MTTEKMWIADTNFLYDGLEQAIDNKKIVLMSTVRQEVDKHKSVEDNNLRYKARKVNRFVFDNYDKFHHDVGEYNPEEILNSDYSRDVMDNRIVACAKVNGYGILTNDLNLYSTAKAFKIEVETSQGNTFNSQQDMAYTGIHKAFISNDDVVSQDLYARIHQDSSDNSFNLLTNQYLIVYDKDNPTAFNTSGEPTRYEVLDKFRFDGTNHVKLKLPENRYIKPKNEEQECAIDLLMNKDIPIKVVSGQVGSGKTYLGVKMALYHVLEKGNHAKVLTLRNTIGSGEEIGFLKGSKEEKIQDFFVAISDQLQGGEQEAEVLKSRGQLESDTPHFIKGRTFTDTFVLVDEAEDLNIKLFKLIGTRLGEHSAIAFVGDVKQAEDKYKSNNGLAYGIDFLKGNPLAGIVVLSEDIRSEASKVFADM